MVAFRCLLESHMLLRDMHSVGVGWTTLFRRVLATLRLEEIPLTEVVPGSKLLQLVVLEEPRLEHYVILFLLACTPGVRDGRTVSRSHLDDPLNVLPLHLPLLDIVHTLLVLQPFQEL